MIQRVLKHTLQFIIDYRVSCDAFIVNIKQNKYIKSINSKKYSLKLKQVRISNCKSDKQYGYYNRLTDNPLFRF